ncbi:MAG: hypothetical protein M1823_005772 [Watsoniomyces obsoletus]|nr:MAG: hypothetical protein M1823_005772 [Watsoniomyces obsoletus]
MITLAPPAGEARKRIFSAVFPQSIHASSQPTPEATPGTQFTAPGQAFGGHDDAAPGSFDVPPTDPVAQQIRWERAWHAATSFLRVPNALAPFPGIQDARTLEREWIEYHPLSSPEGITELLHLDITRVGQKDSLANHALVEWYMNEVRRHFVEFGTQRLQSVLYQDPRRGTIQDGIQILQGLQAIYVFPFLQYVLPAYRDTYPSGDVVSRLQTQFEKDLKITFANFIPQAEFKTLLDEFLRTKVTVVLGLGGGKNEHGGHDEAPESEDQPMVDVGLEDFHAPISSTGGGDAEIQEARSNVLHIFKSLEILGLGAGRSQRVFAEVMNDAMSRYVTETFADQWQAPSKVIVSLRDWVQNHFARLVVEVLHCIRHAQQTNYPREKRSVRDREVVTLEQMGRWCDMSVGRLGRLRITQLFDIVVEWDASRGAVEDLKTYLGSPTTRSHLVHSFTAVLSQRLLHPGASTAEILQMYISLIRVFTLLDPKGVLIERVARPVRRYLRERDDTVKVIVNGLLSKAARGNDTNSSELSDLAVELNRASDRAAQTDDDQELNWDDMNWTPDPIDAGPDYKRSQNADVIGSVMSLFDSKEVLIREFQQVIGERLLRKSFNLEQEVRVLELLKLRFGEGSLQASEVMLRDVEVSGALDRTIREKQGLVSKESHPPGRIQADPTQPTLDTQIHAKILSRLFWPQLHEEGFTLPSKILQMQQRYEQGFEAVKPSRKLTWLNLLGQVTVELELDDRRIVEEVTTWQASVIYAFQDLPASESGPGSRTVDELVMQLSMDEHLVRSALRFWASKRALREVSQDAFRVLESLDDTDAELHGVAPAGTGSHGEEMQLTKSAEEVAAAKMKGYLPFIVGMLTNGGPMPLQQIATMLKFAVAGGFPFSDDELRDYLRMMVQDGPLDFVNGRYKIRS